MSVYDIFSIASEEDFNKAAIDTFRYQYEHTTVYRQFCDLLKKTPENVHTVSEIPFLPIQFFKEHVVLSEEKTETIIFTSSGTTGSVPSRHFVADLSMYEQSFLKGFTKTYGDPEDFVILALLPSYLEREGSSLIYMADRLIQLSQSKESGFYLNDSEALIATLNSVEEEGKKTLLLGVSFALLDLVEQHNFSLHHTIVMETGGMKGRRKEMIREELHERLTTGFGVETIHSEYGMTELLSQGYSKGRGVFECPPWMKVLTRDPENALDRITGKTGGINVIDLANRYSCSFIATQDLGRSHPDGSFEILGRFDTSDIRGCNLMAL